MDKKVRDEIIIELRKDGKTYKHIAAIVGCKSDGPVLRVCQKAGLGGTASWKEKKYAEYKKYWGLGCSIKSICEMFNVSETTVRNALGIHRDKKEVSEERIVELKQQGYNSKEIAAILGVTQECVKYRCRKLGLVKKRDPGEPMAIYKAKQLEDFEYLGGYSGSDGWLVLRCKKCGCEFNASCVTIRKDEDISCPICRAALKQVQWRLERTGRQVKSEAALIDKMLEQLAKDCGEDLQQFNDCAKIHLCKNCGRYTDGIYCSDKCKKNYSNRVHDQRRRAKIKGALVDKDIELMALYHRDNGVCHICGGLCDLSDYWLTEDGNFVAGEGYPSIDHVIPLSKGGKHSWENVKLAHKYCNTIKRDQL